MGGDFLWDVLRALEHFMRKGDLITSDFGAFLLPNLAQ